MAAPAQRPDSGPEDRIPILVNLASRDGGLTKDGRITNAYLEGKKVFRRPGLTPGSVTFGAGQGMTVFNKALIVAGGSVIYQVVSQRTLNSIASPAASAR